jgi:uncharacterized protein YndB with AHSA1/START domain
MRLLLFFALLFPSPATAAVKRATAHSFEIEHRATIAAPPERVWSRFQAIGSWWNPSHSYSGKAEKLSLTLKPGSCLCEELPGGGVEHLRVVYADRPRKAVLTGALGPLFYDALAGVLDVRIEPTGRGSTLIWNYRVSGFAVEDGANLAPVVDRVLGEQVQRLAAAAKR